MTIIIDGPYYTAYFGDVAGFDGSLALKQLGADQTIISDNNVTPNTFIVGDAGSLTGSAVGGNDTLVAGTQAFNSDGFAGVQIFGDAYYL